MKKTILILAMCFLMIGAHQTYAQVQVALGLKAGPNFATINTDASAAANYKSRTGFHGGAFFLFKATKIGIQPEVLFSQQGSKVTINSEDYDANFSYINIPIIVKLYTVAGINLQAGPQFGFVSSAEAPMPTPTVTDPDQITVQDVKNLTKGSDFTVALGLGWDLPFGLTIDARYNLGLSKIYKDAPNTQQTSDAKNQVIQVSLGYKLIKFGK